MSACCGGRETLLWLIGIIPVIGWRQWSPPPATELTNLPLPSLAPDSVVLEVTFVRIPAEKLDFESRFWPEADESALDVELRRRLAANGFRAGVVRTPPPPVLQELFDAQGVPDAADGTTALSGGNEIAVRAHRLRNRTGQPGKVIVRGTTIPKLAAWSRTKAAAFAENRSIRLRRFSPSRPIPKRMDRSASK